MKKSVDKVNSKWPKIKRVDVKIGVFNCHTLDGVVPVKGFLYKEGNKIFFKEAKAFNSSNIFIDYVDARDLDDFNVRNFDKHN